jgi:anti-sigma factor RsiW
MNTREAKLVLRAWRPGDEGEDGTVFREALERVRDEPELAAWLEREQAFDRAVGAALKRVSPPDGLRQAILIGGRASRMPKPWWRRPAVFGIAAVLVMAVGVSLFRIPSGPESGGSGSGLEPMALMRFAVHNLVHGPHGHSMEAGSLRLEEALSRHEGGLVESAEFAVSADEAERAGCQRFVVGGREVFEICFQRDGAWFHLYLVRSDPARGTSGGGAGGLAVLESDGVAAATWERAGTIYTLATRSGMDALRRLL